MASRDVFECGLEVSEGFDAVDLCGLDQGGDTPPCLSALVMSCKQRIFAIERQFPFILPMSGRFIVSIIDGMPILART